MVPVRKSLPRGLKRHEPDAELFEGREDVLFRRRHHRECSLWRAVTGWRA